MPAILASPLAATIPTAWSQPARFQLSLSLQDPASARLRRGHGLQNSCPKSATHGNGSSLQCGDLGSFVHLHAFKTHSRCSTRHTNWVLLQGCPHPKALADRVPHTGSGTAPWSIMLTARRAREDKASADLGQLGLRVSSGPQEDHSHGRGDAVGRHEDVSCRVVFVQGQEQVQGKTGVGCTQRLHGDVCDRTEGLR